MRAILHWEILRPYDGMGSKRTVHDLELRSSSSCRSFRLLTWLPVYFDSVRWQNLPLASHHLPPGAFERCQARHGAHDVGDDYGGGLRWGSLGANQRHAATEKGRQKLHPTVADEFLAVQRRGNASGDRKKAPFESIQLWS